MIERLRTSIAFRSALIVLGIAVLVASVSSIVGYIYFARSEQESAIHRMRNLLSTVENTASIACYLADQNLASEVAHGLLKNGDIKRVRIASEVTTLADYSKNNPAHKSLAGIPLNKENLALEQDIGAPFNAKEIVCHIHMELDQDFIESQSSSKALFIVYQLVFQALLMAIVVIFVVLMYITRPIKTISDSLHSLSPETGNKIALPKGNEHDDIGQLVRDINRLVSNLVSTLDEERTLRVQHAIGEKKLQTIFENSETGIFEMNSLAQLISCNTAFLRIFAITTQLSQGDFSGLLIRLLEGQELRLHLMIDMAMNESKVVSEDFCVSVGRNEQKKWVNLVINPTQGDILQGLVNDITDRKQNEEQANYLAVTDHLTGVNNRLGFEKEIAQLAREHARGQGKGFFLLMIDLDKFKQVNDTYGHLTGDQVLCNFANILLNTVRKTDFVSRIGGDEFIVLLKDLTHQDKAEAIATKIIAQATEPLIINERVTIHIGASIGISSSGPQAFDVDRLLRQADGAMYQVKQHGRNAYRVADPSSA